MHWLRGRRYVEDGTVTTTAAVTSGVPGALHLVAELAGPAEAQRVADQHPELGWTPTESDDHRQGPLRGSRLARRPQLPEPWFRPTVGIALHDGVGELDATAAFEVYGQSAAARTIAIGTGDTVRTRHGLVLLTTPLTQAPDLSRVLVPGASRDAIDPRLTPGPTTSTSPSNHSRADPVRTDLAAAGSLPHCRTSPTTPTPAPPARPRK